MGHPGDQKEAQVPEGRVAFVAEVPKHLRERGAVPGEKPGLPFILPQLMAEQHDQN